MAILRSDINRAAFKERLADGTVAEDKLIAALTARGELVCRFAFEEGGEVPRFEVVPGVVVNKPDLVFPETQRYGEVKTKTEWVRNPLRGWLETGWNLDHWQHYQTLLEYAPLDFYVIHEVMEPTGVFKVEGRRLLLLWKHSREWDGCHFATGQPVRRTNGRAQEPLFLVKRALLTKVMELDELYAGGGQ